MNIKKQLRIIIENCPQNHSCPAVEVCPIGALDQEGFNAPTINYDKCMAVANAQGFVRKKHW